MKRKVSHLTVHQSLFFPGMGTLEKTLPGKLDKRMTLSTSEYGILVQMEGNEGVIPYANIVNFSLAKEQDDKPTKK